MTQRGIAALERPSIGGGPFPRSLVGRVSAVSTGTVRIHPEHAQGSRLPALFWLLGSRRWTAELPINVFVIEHREGLVLFDTGQDYASVTEPDYFPGGFAGLVFKRLARFEMGPGDTLSNKLRAAGYSPDDVRVAILSHLHQDHIGGIRELRNARLVATEPEWAAVEAGVLGYLPNHTDLPGLQWQRIGFTATTDPDLAPFTASHDLLGDGSVVLLPTPGHTRGSLSAFVRSASADFLMVGDLTYGLDLLESGRTPGARDDRDALVESSARVVEMARRNTRLIVLPAHDPGAPGRLAAVTGQPKR